MADQPRNLDYYLQRMTGYSKNTIRIQPTSKNSYVAGDTLVFRLPTNSILDLHTFNLKFAGRLKNNMATNAYQAAWPRYTSSFIRRNDWTFGGMQVGLGALHDYGFLAHWLKTHRVPLYRTQADMSVTELAGTPQINGVNFYTVAANSTTAWQPLSLCDWLGIGQGSFMRFLDTNLMPDIEIRILLAPNAILPSGNTQAISYELKNFSITVESISFGDGSYRAMVDARMASGQPLMIPFFNWTGFEGSSGQSQFNQQFTVATESLNALIGTVRPGNYDSQLLPQLGGQGTTAGTTTANSTFYVPQYGYPPSRNDASILRPDNAFFNWFHTSLSLEQTAIDQFGRDGQWQANLQFNIDSKLYPQFMADVGDCWHLLKNAFDANALSITYGGNVYSMDQFTQGSFGCMIGLDHHADDGGKDHLISGLNTTGSLIPIVFSVQGNMNSINGNDWLTALRTMCGNTFRPTVFCNMTSTLMVYKGRVISVVN